MEITPAGGVVKEATSMQESSVEEFEKDIGSMHVKQKSSNFASQESSKLVSESVSQVSSSVLNENGINTSEVNGDEDVIRVRGKVNEEIKSEEIKTTLKGIISEIENNLPPHLIEEETKSQQVNNQEIDKLSDLARQRLAMTDRQTSTTSLEEQQKECTAQALLCLLTKGDIGIRPHSMPANLAHLWHSLKIASELEQTLSGGGDKEPESDSAEEASGHKVNFEDGLQTKPIDLEKLFTPASDSGEITPSRNRKVYASSSFYAPYHPTMEEQVELARRISHSLSDISNKESKGQSMYVNRKKRSVKWVHEGEGKLTEQNSETENFVPAPQNKKESKPPLKLVMNPRGQVQDITTLRKQGLAFEPMSPEVCLDLVRDLNAPRGKGAELFAKRRKKSEKWIIDENNVKTVESSLFSGGSTPLNKLPSPSYLKDSTHRVENVQKMNQIQERFTLPRLKMIKSPWEAALEGSVESAFQEINSPRGVVMAPTPNTLKKLASPTPPLPLPQLPVKEELYKPKPPRAWNPQPTCKTFTEESTGQPVIVAPTSAPPPVVQASVNYTSLNNYNTAPRGWQSSMSYYRPVTFNTKPTYSDF